VSKKNRTATAAFANVIPTTTDPRIYKKLEALAAAALTHSKNAPEVRAAIASLNLEMRAAAEAQLGHDGVDNTGLALLLKRTDPARSNAHVAPAPARDPIDVLELQGFLEPIHVSAAFGLRDVWAAFGRCLSIAGRNYEGGGGAKRGCAMQPLDVMGDNTWEFYQEVFIPWYQSVKDLKVNRKDTGNVTAAQIIFRVVIDEYFPEQVDAFLQLVPGTALWVMKKHLGRFYETLEVYPLGNLPSMVKDQQVSVAA